MRTRMWLALALLALAGVAQADHLYPGIEWPGWRVECGGEHIDSRYPLTAMLDGNLRTAWVLGKGKPEEGEEPFNHGRGVRITLRKAAGAMFNLDTIALTNGYAKSTPVYWRNNRIRAISLMVSTKNGWWEKRFSLQNTRKLQLVRLPKLRTNYLEITIEQVEAGRDDDLCISELELRNGGKPIPWKITPYVMQNDANGGCGCGGGPEYALYTRAGKAVKSAPSFVAFALQPENGSRMLACSEKTAYLYNIRTGKRQWSHRLGGYLGEQSLGWIGRGVAYLRVDPEIHAMQGQQWYKLITGSHIAFTPMRAPTHEPRYRTETQGPYYGA